MRRTADFLAGLALLTVLAWAGDVIADALRLTVPGPVIGLGLYWALLRALPAAARTVPAATWLTGWLGLLIVPAMVGLMAFAPLFTPGLAARLAGLLLATTALTGLTTAGAYRWLRR